MFAAAAAVGVVAVAGPMRLSRLNAICMSVHAYACIMRQSNQMLSCN